MKSGASAGFFQGGGPFFSFFFLSLGRVVVSDFLMPLDWSPPPHYAFVVIRHGGGVAKVKKCRISWLAFVYYYDWSRGQPFVPRENTSKVDKIDIKGLGRWWSSSWSNSACERARDLIFF